MKKVLITGGSRGIGRATVYLFASAGWEVGFTYYSSKTEADAITHDLANESTVHAFQADLSQESELSRLCDSVHRVMGDIDVLVNNAGVSSYGLFTDVDRVEFFRVMDTNFSSAFFLTQYFVPSMIRNRFGSIINVSSVWGQTGASCEVLYSASTAALIGFTKALAKELAPSGVAVNCVAPGVVDTDMMSCFTSEEKKEIAEDIPACRFASPSEIARVIFNMATQSSSYLTGQIIGINGGMFC